MNYVPPRFPHSPTPPALIRIRNLTKYFGANRVLDDVSLDIGQGEVRCIIGPSGSGKSTLLRCLNALTDFDGGALVLDETRVGYAERRGALKPWTEREAASFRQRVGLVSQHVNLFAHRTVLENVIEGPVQVLGTSRSVAVRAATDLLARVGLSDKHDSYPSQLSGGQQQRAAIARALAMHPDVMLFDEPTSALDPERVGEVLKVMRALALEGRTMLVVTHEMAFAREVASRVIFLHEGLVEEDGPADQVFDNPTSERFRKFIATTQRS